MIKDLNNKNIIISKGIYGNVGIIGDTHLPFEHRNYLDFCIQTFKKYKCKTIIHIGDVVDNHAISYHEKNPNGMSPAEEMSQAKIHLKPWFKAFPRVKICRGNHDKLIARKAVTAGLAKGMIKEFADVFELPIDWEYGIDYNIDDVLYTHGDGFGGRTPHTKICETRGQNVVIGHYHSVAGISWKTTEKDRLFGMSVGCGVDRNSYAFDYGSSYAYKPIVSCGVVLENGKLPIQIPMFMENFK